MNINQNGLQLSPAQIYAIHKHCQNEVPREACGLLAGIDGIVKIVLPVMNIAPGKTTYEMDARAQLRALELIEAEGLELLAIYHSHPKGPPHPSESDIRKNQYDVLHLINSRAGRNWVSMAFRLTSDNYVELPVTVRQ